MEQQNMPWQAIAHRAARALCLSVLLLTTALVKAETLALKEPIILVTGPNLKSCFKMLMAGRVDFIKINHYVANYVIHQIDVSADNIRALPFLVERVSLHMMVPKTRRNARALISEFDRIFSEIQQTERIEEWTQTYLKALNPGSGQRP
ncbi:MAG: hypothetical protein ABR522_10635 [Marinobacter sp.]